MPPITELLAGIRRKLGTPKPKATVRAKYHAVAIRPGTISCQSVQRWTGRRLLSKDAPGLPVPGCNLPKCNCQYRHYADRRAGPRRVADQFNLPVEFSGKERRAGRGRRASDRLPKPKI